MSTLHYIRAVDWNRPNSAPYLCGAMGGSATSKASAATCEDCRIILDGGSEPRPLHEPPYMNEDEAGIFRFFDVDHRHPTPQLRQEEALEVIPQTTGNVEFYLCGNLFTLHHLDRADLIRALLHDFHYSPEFGGPGDDPLRDQ